MLKFKKLESVIKDFSLLVFIHWKSIFTSLAKSNIVTNKICWKYWFKLFYRSSKNIIRSDLKHNVYINQRNYAQWNVQNI